MSSTVTFTRVGANEARIHDADGDYVGDLFRQRDILKPASSFFVIHLSEDPRGPLRVPAQALASLCAGSSFA